jgi:hypothetical protein
LQLRDRIGRPEKVGDLVHLGREGLPELSEDHRRFSVAVAGGMAFRIAPYNMV